MRRRAKKAEQMNQNKAELPTTRTGEPDMRLAVARHDPALVVGQALLDATNQIFRDISKEDLDKREDRNELAEMFPGGLEGQTTGHADMRLAPTRHDPKLVAMQQVLDRVKETRHQIAINKGLVDGEKDSLPTLRELFESEFLDSGDLAGIAAELVPDYEIVRLAHEKYGEPPVSAIETTIAAPPLRRRRAA